jgi:hypothetical protein
MKRSLELEPRAAEGGTAKISKTKSVSGLIRGSDSKSRVQRKAAGGTDRMSVQASPSQPRPDPVLMRKPSATVLSPPPGSERGPPPSLPPTNRPGSQDGVSSGPSSPRDRAATPPGPQTVGSPVPSTAVSSAGVEPASPAPPTASFRTVRSGIRASSPNLSAGSSAGAVGSPMIGNKRPTTTLRSNSGEGGLSSSPESPSTPLSGVKPRPAPAPRKVFFFFSSLFFLVFLKKTFQDVASPTPGAKSPAPRKALPKPPTSTDVSDEEEEDANHEDL